MSKKSISQTFLDILKEYLMIQSQVTVDKGSELATKILEPAFSNAEVLWDVDPDGNVYFAVRENYISTGMITLILNAIKRSGYNVVLDTPFHNASVFKIFDAPSGKVDRTRTY